MYQKSLVLIFFFSIIEFIVADEDNLIVALEDGKLEGTYKTSYDGRKFMSFEGIPFASPAIGNNRFRDPQPVKKWNGIIKANRTYACTQYLGTQILGDEDCLYIDVYVPRERINPNDNLDVIVHIHGGAFMMGSGHGYSGPIKLMDRDVAFVNFNYRLGPFGFLATGDGLIDGNYGLKDQLFALKWVQKNIGKFGGNKDSVTITGVSAGAASAHLLYFASNSDGLFHRAWIQSGAASNPWAIKRNPKTYADKLIKSLNCTGESMEVAIDCLRGKKAADLAGAVKDAYYQWMVPIAPFAPVVEKINDQNSLLVEHPYDQLKSGKVSNVPLVISQTTGEGSVPSLFLQNRLDDINKNWEEYAPFVFEYDYLGEEKQKEISKKIKEHYLNNEDVSPSNFGNFVKLCNERMFHIGAEEIAKLQANVSSENVFFMMFGYVGSEDDLKRYLKFVGGSEFKHGVPHGMDAKFLYNFDINAGLNFNLKTSVRDLNSEEEKMKNNMLDAFVSFAKSGSPNMKGVNWEPVSKDGSKLKYLMVNNPDDMQMKITEKLGDTQFWKSLDL